MKKKLIAIIALVPLLAASGGQMVNTGNHRKIMAAACTAPTMTSRWAAYNPSNLCTGSVACTNGATTTSVPDFLGASNSTSANAVYVTGSVNGLPSFSFSSAQIVLPSGGTVSASGSITLYAVLKPSATPFTGGIFGSAVNSGPEWRIESTGGKQEFLKQGIVSIGTSTSAVSTAAYSTIVMTYNYTSGVLTFYKCASGTCTTDGTATSAPGFTLRQNVLGFASVVNEQFVGNIAEWGYLNSSSTAGIAAWSQCKYGI